MESILLSILLLLSYLCGSISSAILICRAKGLADPREQGSNNPGTTNVARMAGKKTAALVLISDMLKGVIPVLVARLVGLENLALGLIALSAIVGHMFPIFFKFQGGKGVATALGCIIALSPTLALSVLFVFALVLALTRYVSLASMVAASSAIVMNLWLGNVHYSIALGMIAMLIIIRHQANIRRLLDGNESRFR